MFSQINGKKIMVYASKKIYNQKLLITKLIKIGLLALISRVQPILIDFNQEVVLSKVSMLQWLELEGMTEKIMILN